MKIIKFSFLAFLLCVSFAGCALVAPSAQKPGAADTSAEISFTVENIEMDFENILYEKVKSEILKWNEADIYAISFFVYSNEAFTYRNFSNVTMWSVSYNTEADCGHAGEMDEERRNYAFWRHNEVPIIDVETPNAYTELLFDWYAARGITNVGYEDENNMFDEEMRYIGKGPVGEYELCGIAADIALRLQTEGLIESHFGRRLPILIHGLEYPWYNIEATRKANSHVEADTFITALQRLGITG